MVVQEVLQRQEPWTWGVQWPAIGSWQWPTESHHQSWSSYNYARSCWRTQRRPFYSHLASEANWKGEKAQSGGLSWADSKSKISSFWSASFSHSMQQWTISQSDCDMWQKVDFIWQLAITCSVVGPRRSFKALPKAKFAPKKGHGHYLIYYSFLNPSKTITSEKYAQQISEMHQKLQHLQPALVNRKGPILLPTSHGTNQCFNSWMNWAMKFCLIHHIHPTSWRPIIISSSISKTCCRENTSKPGGDRKCFPGFIEFQSTDVYAMGVNLFLIGKNMLIVTVPILTNKDVFEPSCNDLKFMVWNHNYVCTNLIYDRNCITTQCGQNALFKNWSCDSLLFIWNKSVRILPTSYRKIIPCKSSI